MLSVIRVRVHVAPEDGLVYREVTEHIILDTEDKEDTLQVGRV